MQGTTDPFACIPGSFDSEAVWGQPQQDTAIAGFQAALKKAGLPAITTKPHKPEKQEKEASTKEAKDLKLIRPRAGQQEY